MNDPSDVLARAAALEEARTPYALATVVKVEGSSYRRPGARMVVSAPGAACGAISGGCLEAEVRQHAAVLLDEGAPPTVLTFEEDLDDELGYGTGCGGTVHVLVEPRPDDDRADAAALLRTCLAERRSAVLATVGAAPGASAALLGHHLLVRPDGRTEGHLPDARLRDHVVVDAVAALQQLRARITRYPVEGGQAEVLLEVVRPPVRLVVFGAGHDVGPVTKAASALGWDVTVVGTRPPEVLRERFPAADAHVFLMHPGELHEHVGFDARSAAVVMNHNLARDRALLRGLLRADVPYIGMLGPQERTQRMLDALRDEGVEVDADRFRAVYAPVGLDIGTETPEEIALSIVAEVQAALHARRGGPMRERGGPIHEAVPVD